MGDTKQVQKATRRPPNAGKGRKAGTPNKVTAQLKDMILGALDAAGGQEYLLARANDPETQKAFLTLLGRVLPLQVTGADEGPLKVEIIRFGDTTQ